MITKIDHIGIAVSSIKDALKLYTDVLGLKLVGTEVVEEQKVRTAIIAIGDCKIELLEATGPESTIAKFIEKRGEGLHHISLETSDINTDLKAIAGKGIALIDKAPRKGVENTSMAFLHPRDTKVLMELTQIK